MNLFSGIPVAEPSQKLVIAERLPRRGRASFHSVGVMSRSSLTGHHPDSIHRWTILLTSFSVQLCKKPKCYMVSVFEVMRIDHNGRPDIQRQTP